MRMVPKASSNRTAASLCVFVLFLPTASDCILYSLTLTLIKICGVHCIFYYLLLHDILYLPLFHQ